jgi:hypothetical protein
MLMSKSYQRLHGTKFLVTNSSRLYRTLSVVVDGKLSRKTLAPQSMCELHVDGEVVEAKQSGSTRDVCVDQMTVEVSE